MAQRLAIYQSLWAMELRRPDGVERTIEESFAMVAKAGFDGMAIDLGLTDIESVYAAKPLFTRHKLGCLINAFPRSIEGLLPALEMAREFEAPFVNVIGQVMPLTVEGMIPVVRRWIEQSNRLGVPIQFETHRNCITNDLYTTLQLIDAVPEMRLCADLSHFLLDREFPYPIAARDQAHIRRILERADSIQGRVASREQIQVPLAFPQNRKWLELFLDWWELGFRLWRQRMPVDETLIFLCELGPPEYAITGADGHELSDRWEESLVLRDYARRIWNKLDSEPA